MPGEGAKGSPQPRGVSRVCCREKLRELILTLVDLPEESTGIDIVTSETYRDITRRKCGICKSQESRDFPRSGEIVRKIIAFRKDVKV
jgi:hypothetical protein